MFLRNSAVSFRGTGIENVVQSVGFSGFFRNFLWAGGANTQIRKCVWIYGLGHRNLNLTFYFGSDRRNRKLKQKGGAASLVVDRSWSDSLHRRRLCWFFRWSWQFYLPFSLEQNRILIRKANAEVSAFKLRQRIKPLLKLQSSSRTGNPEILHISSNILT